MSSATERRRMRVRNRLHAQMEAAPIDNSPLEYQGEPMNLDLPIHSEVYAPTKAYNALSYALFTLVPFGGAFAVLAVVKPSFVMGDDQELNYSKVFLFSALCGIAGLLVKFFMFRSRL